MYLDSESGRREKKEQVSEAIVNKEGESKFETDFRHRPQTKENGPRGNELEKGNGNRGTEVVVTARGVEDSLRHGKPRLHKGKLVQENLQISLAPTRSLFENFRQLVR